MTARELFNQLNQTDEVTKIEAKPGTGISKSVMETICAFANEPGIEEGYVLLRAVIDESSLFPQYIIDKVTDLDKLQSALATNCASIFSRAIRPEISVEQINGQNVAVIKVKELPLDQKPLYFKKEGLPSGAYRRVGPTDHRCTEDDMHVFYADQKTYDSSFLENTSLRDIDERSLRIYRDLRTKINPAAEELTYTDEELLQSLGCYAVDGTNRLSIAGMVLFGKSGSLRRIFPMLRVDYIRVSGTQWVADPDERYSTIDMRGPLLTLVFRIVDAVYGDLPKGFKLEDGLQASPKGMPVKVLREAIINALMHRSYRVSSPIQVIRYDNRLEIINPGFSLKSEEMLGTPSSETRNPFIAAVFHETNLAETKGSGIRAMKKMLAAAELAPPTFNSSRTNNQFTARLLLHHFLNSSDLKWLAKFEKYELNDSQKRAIIFLRETGAIDNRVYRQLSDTDTITFTLDLRQLRGHNLITQKGKGRYTYYRPTDYLLNTEPQDLSTEPLELNTEPQDLSTEPSELITHGDLTKTHGKMANTHDKMAKAQGEELKAHGKMANTHGRMTKAHGETNTSQNELIKNLEAELQQKILKLGARVKDKEQIKDIIRQLCTGRELTIAQLASILKKDERYLSRTFIKPLLDDDMLAYKYPTMPKHPDQAYRAVDND